MNAVPEDTISDYLLHSSKCPTQMSTHTTEIGYLHYRLNFDPEKKAILQTLMMLSLALVKHFVCLSLDEMFVYNANCPLSCEHVRKAT